MITSGNVFFSVKYDRRLTPDEVKDTANTMDSINAFSFNIQDGHINTPFEKLTNLIRIYGRRTVEYTLAGFIQNGMIQYPLKRFFMKSPENILAANGVSGPKSYFKEEPYVSELEKWLSYNTYKFVGKEIILYHVYDDYNDFDILTDYFTEYARIKARAGKNGAPVDTWRTRNSAVEVAKGAIEYTLKTKKPLNMEMIESGIYKGKIRMATTFRISLGIKMYEFFKATFVFDPFAGWGDRAIAAALTPSVKRYIGTDPNSDLREGYSNLIEFTQRVRPDTQVDIFDSPIEDLDLGLVTKFGSPDLVFSSPPFFTYEIYTEEATQSVNRYPDADAWLNKWFLPQMIRVWDILAVGGHMVMYLGDSRVNMSSSLIETMQRDRPQSSKFLGAIPTYHESRKKRPVFFYIWKKV